MPSAVISRVDDEKASIHIIAIIAFKESASGRARAMKRAANTNSLVSTQKRFVRDRWRNVAQRGFIV